MVTSLENCDPTVGMVVAHSSFKPCSATTVLHESNPNTICNDGRPGRVQSLVQAFEHMISLTDVRPKRRNMEQAGQPLKVSCCVEQGESIMKTSRVEQQQELLNSGSDVQGDKLTEPICTESWREESDGKDENPCDEEEVGKSASHDGDSSTSSTSDFVLYPKPSRVTCLQPFSLRTQARGAKKEVEFRKKLEKMWEDDNKLRIPMAQGLPWTTDEPETVPKPPPRESTVPMDIRLCSEFRSVQRAQFDQYMTSKLMQVEQERQERRRLHELAEQEEIKRLRKEMVPRAQLMPLFDRPFIPQRSSKPLTVPKEPEFHCCSHEHKKNKCCTVSH